MHFVVIKALVLEIKSILTNPSDRVNIVISISFNVKLYCIRIVFMA